jgi:hypothetical protein
MEPSKTFKGEFSFNDKIEIFLFLLYMPFPRGQSPRFLTALITWSKKKAPIAHVP